MYYKEVKKKNESERSTPYPNHVPVRRSAQLEHPGVPGLLSPHSPRNQVGDLPVRVPSPHRPQQVRFVVPEKADLEVAVRHEPYPVARVAKVLGHRGDKANLPGEALGPEILGHLAPPPGGGCHRPDRLLDPSPRLRVGLHLLPAPHIPVKRHPLDEPDVEWPVPCELHKVQDLVLVLPLHHHDVQLHLLEPQPQCVVHGREHLPQALA
mmetsp:Transcript_7479/g.25735  ORF Transcript_7479/g.25735 Transcript_7479/m.25735 type:complete len:209 (+) Transcript_7479:53-679(+)